MRRSPILFALILTVSGCSTSTSATDEDEYAPLFAADQASPNTETPIGTWALTKEEAGVRVEARMELTRDAVRFANRCTKDGESVVVGVKSAATVTDTQVTIREGSNKSEPFAGTLACKISLTAGDGTLALDKGRLNFNGAILFDRKVRD